MQYQAPPLEVVHQAAWRLGPVAVLGFGAVLPSRCAKCNAPADAKVNISVRGSGPHTYRLGFWRSDIGDVLHYLATREQATIAAYLCRRHRTQRRIWRMVRSCCVLAAVASVAMMLMRLALPPRVLPPIYLTIAFLVAAIVGGVASHVAAQTLRGVSFTASHVYVSGFCPAFLALLPSAAAAHRDDTATAAEQLARVQ